MKTVFRKIFTWMQLFISAVFLYRFLFIYTSFADSFENNMQTSWPFTPKNFGISQV